MGFLRWLLGQWFQRDGNWYPAPLNHMTMRRWDGSRWLYRDATKAELDQYDEEHVW